MPSKNRKIKSINTGEYILNKLYWKLVSHAYLYDRKRVNKATVYKLFSLAFPFTKKETRLVLREFQERGWIKKNKKTITLKRWE